MPLPSVRFVWLLAAASLLYLIDARAALLVDALLLALGAWDWWILGGSRWPAVIRSAPSRIQRGARGEVILEARAPESHGARLRLTDDLPPYLEREGPRILYLNVPAGASARAVYSVRAVGRGPGAVGDLWVRALGPLGLAWRQHRIPLRDPVQVLPAISQVNRLRLSGLRRRLREVGLRNTRQRGEGRSFESLRPYVRGDDPRAIDWKATARHSEVVVRQYEAERSQSVVLALDLGRSMLEKVGAQDRLDHALTAALLLAHVAAAQGDRVGALLFADRVQQFLPPRRVAPSRIADALSGARARMVEPNYPLAFATLMRQVRRRSLIVLFTDIVDPLTSSALLGQMSRSAQRHLLMAVALQNPGLATLAAKPAESREAAYRRAAAEEMLEARRVALRTMRHAGVLVADPQPSDLVTEVVNRYLDVKYRSLL